MLENFLGAFVSIRTLRTPALTARKHTCGSLRLRLHEPHVFNFMPREVHSQYSVMVTDLHTNCS